MLRVALLLATAAHSGYVPVAPGTAGSLVGVIIHFLMRARESSAGLELVVVFGLCAAGVWAAGAAEKHLGERDPRPVVVDEVVGMLVTLLRVSAGWPAVLIGFLLFRFFDIVKPYPADRLERLPGGWGIMADDLIAAAYAHAALRLLLWIAPGWMA